MAFPKTRQRRRGARLLRCYQRPNGCVYILPNSIYAQSVAADFNTMEHKLETSQYPSVDSFIADCQLVFDNCRSYNPETTIYSRNATKLEKFLKDQLLDHVKREG